METPSISIYYNAAQNRFSALQIFMEDGIFQDYIRAEPQEFVRLCTKVCEQNLKACDPDMIFELKGRTLKTSQNDSNAEEAGAIILQSFQGQWSSSTGKLSKRASVAHIFLYLDQQFNDADLQISLQELGQGTGIVQGYEDPLDIHIYAFYYILESSYSNKLNHSVYVHQTNELKLSLLEYQNHQSLKKHPKK